MRSTVDDREMSVTGAAKINMFEFTAVIIVKGQTACRTALGLCWIGLFLISYAVVTLT